MSIITDNIEDVSRIDSIEVTADAASPQATTYTKTEVDTNVYTKTEVDSTINSLDVGDVGDIITRPVNVIPSRYLECNGTELDTVAYSALYSVIGTSYSTYADWVISTEYFIGDIRKSTSTADGLYYEAITDGISAGDDTDLTNGSDTGVSWKIATKFQVPDLRGEFIRGFDNGRGIDSGRIIGSFQLDSFQGHKHHVAGSTSDGTADVGSTDYNGSNPFRVDDVGEYDRYVGDPVNDTINGTPRTTNETRPRNIAMIFCIKYKP